MASCRCCETQGLEWRELKDRGWRLFDVNGLEHACPPGVMQRVAIKHSKDRREAQRTFLATEDD